MIKTIGLDIGGTKINGAIVDKNGEILKTYKLETCADEGAGKVLDNIEKIINKLKDYDDYDIKAIGVGTPGFIDSKNGIVKFAGNIEGWTGLNLKKEIEKRSKLPTFVENDANIALICEKWLGAGKKYNDIVMITLGTGLGGAIFNPKMGLLQGSNYQGAELGHMILYPNGDSCTCGQSGCAEAYCSGSAIRKHYKNLTNKEKNGEEIFELYDKDEASKKVIDRFIDDLSWYLTSLRNVFDPELIIIGGGVINSRKYWWDRLIEKFNKRCHLADKVLVEPAKFLNDAGVIGAGKIAMERLENE